MVMNPVMPLVRATSLARCPLTSSQSPTFGFPKLAQIDFVEAHGIRTFQVVCEPSANFQRRAQHRRRIGADRPRRLPSGRRRSVAVPLPTI